MSTGWEDENQIELPKAFTIPDCSKATPAMPVRWSNLDYDFKCDGKQFFFWRKNKWKLILKSELHKYGL